MWTVSPVILFAVSSLPAESSFSFLFFPFGVLLLPVLITSIDFISPPYPIQCLLLLVGGDFAACAVVVL